MLTGTRLEVEEALREENQTTYEESQQEMTNDFNCNEALSNKIYKFGCVVGTIVTTGTYYGGYYLFSHSLPIASLTACTLPFIALCTVKMSGDSAIKRSFAGFAITGAFTNLLNTVGNTVLPATYPLAVPIVTLNVVACSALATPEVCINLSKLGKKLSDSCFSLWNRVSRKNEEAPLKELIVNESSFTPGRSMC